VPTHYAITESQLPDSQLKSAHSDTGVYELTQRFFFESAHTLHRSIETESSMRIHGHTYEAEITIRGYPDSGTGMLTDIGFLNEEISRVHGMLDHRLLDDVKDLGPATLENLCAFIRKHLESRLPGLCAVMVERRVGGNRCVLRW
jgi:6-pyruvoyltetrahydropterin/6-carboxytetrahydropterin synthase